MEQSSNGGKLSEFTSMHLFGYTHEKQASLIKAMMTYIGNQIQHTEEELAQIKADLSDHIDNIRVVASFNRTQKIV